MNNEEIMQLAVALWDEGYRRIDVDKPGWVRWHSINGAEEHEPREIPMEVWWFFRGCNFGVGDYNQRRGA